MLIRKMTRQDIPAVTETDCSAFDKPWKENDFNTELEKAHSYYVVAENGNELAGYAGIWCIYETAELIRIASSPSERRKGAADALMRDIMRHAAECGCEHMLLEVRSGNAAARSLYEKHGFRQIDIRKGYYDGEDAVIMEKILH